MEIDNKSTIYFPVYKRIEKEIQELATAIYFCDEQRNVYSLEIADLIVRCVIEIESIAKDIYRRETNTEPSSPGSCITWLEEKWNIDKKKVSIISSYFHFDKMKSFFPFDYINKSEEDYYSIYNAIKHDRVKNINKATIYALVRSLGALYLLNVYFKNERIQLEEDHHGSHIDRSFGSDIFTVEVAPCVDLVILSSEEQIVPEQCVYRIIRKESEYAFSFSYVNQFDEVKSFSMVMIDKDFQDYAAQCTGRSIKLDEFWEFMAKKNNSTVEQVKASILMRNKCKEIKNIHAYKMKASFWAELNK